ncbi:MAG: prephenate dehydrogenase [Candidatus Omnitrophica bacterium]|nr:prephenate dehydrogenase [Candidatus Omnitrophota bacterium]
MPRKIAIIGLGLMGGSLGLALKRAKPRPRVIGISRSKSKVRNAVRLGIIAEGTTSLASGVRSADLVVIATPVHTVAALVAVIDRLAKPGTVVTDVGSTKSEILKTIHGKKLKNVLFVGSHPMAGSHQTGFAAARANLYKDACVFVIRESAADKRALANVAKLWRSVGGRVETVTARAHDQIAAAISQLPHLVAISLVNSVSSRSLRFAGNGFQDTTRVAQGDPHLWVDIIRTNRRNLVREINKFSRKLVHLAKILKNDQKGKLLAELARAKRIRSRIQKPEK